MFSKDIQWVTQSIYPDYDMNMHGLTYFHPNYFKSQTQCSEALNLYIRDFHN